MPIPTPLDLTAYDDLQAKVNALAVDLPGLTFGYIGNCGVDRSGPFDDRSWHVFLPHPGRVGTYFDSVSLGATDNLPHVKWPCVEAQVRAWYSRSPRQAVR